MSGQKYVVIGAGPVGALAALYAAHRGHQVEVYELRGDLRDPNTFPLNFTKSINLALSERGIHGLRDAGRPGLLNAVLEETLPMYGRMIHGSKSGELYEESQQYDAKGRAIRAVDRAQLNKRLLDELNDLPNVKIFFNHKLTGADFKKNKAWFEQKSLASRTDHAQNPTQQDEDVNRDKEIEVSFDFMIGADGAHSAVRYHLMKYARMSYTQEYIDTLWCEFHMTASTSSDFRISPNHLHIWPGQEFMFIAIPSLDKSFTCTLFLPASRFSELDADPTALIPFFNTHFPGVAGNLIPEPEIAQQYKENPHLPLISIKCSPHHYGSSAVILGDAAHAMVPFYGQGMNAGLEDVRVLFNFLDSQPATPTGRAAALDAYTTQRAPDAHAINDLALRNYQEMRADVVSPLYRLRKTVEEALSTYLPSAGFATQYSRVSFGDMRYSDVEKMAQKQGRILQGVAVAVLGVLLPAAGYGAWAYWRWQRASRTTKGFIKGGLGLGAISERIGRIFT
ncbi:hypothetical protein MBLNU457_4619t2 [Dothideomycetes sp. NU457]